MTAPRQLPLYDAGHKPETWNERMVPGEYAVHYAKFELDTPDAPYCTVFGSLQDAVTYAQEQVTKRTDLRCALYDHHGLIGPPVRDIRGRDFKENEISARFRRWVGSILFFGGSILTIVDWAKDFRFLWPSALGTRMLMPGFALLFMEAMVLLHKRLSRRRSGEKGVA
ncbi:MAG TPA: hypothetical protein VK596_04250 [Edaphobacter sp.]|nr:hypothetical protein [Edaphobacter sp.]